MIATTKHEEANDDTSTDEEALIAEFRKQLVENTRLFQLVRCKQAEEKVAISEKLPILDLNSDYTLESIKNSSANEKLCDEESKEFIELKEKLETEREKNKSSADNISQKEALLLQTEVEIIQLELQLRQLSEFVLRRDPTIKELEQERIDIQLKKRKQSDDCLKNSQNNELLKIRQRTLQQQSDEIEKELREEEHKLKLISHESDELQRKISKLKARQPPITHDALRNNLRSKVYLDKKAFNNNPCPNVPPKPSLLPDNHNGSSLPDERKVADMRRLFDKDGTSNLKSKIKRHQSSQYLNEIPGNDATPSATFVEKKGYLQRKQVHNLLGRPMSNAVWCTYFTLLHRRHLLFYKDEHAFDINDAAAYPQDLKGASIESIDSNDGKLHTFRLTTRSGSKEFQFIFSAKNRDEAEDWIAKIKHKIAFHSNRDL